MSDMVERVARAVWKAMATKGHPHSWELLHPIKKDQMLEIARFAIAAMREPTEEQTRAGHLEFDLLPFGIAPGPFTIQKIYRAMIDEAMK
jgi:hypothetical protein